MKPDDKRIMFQSNMTAERLDKLRAIASYRGISMSHVLWGWIEAAYKRLPPEARECAKEAGR